MSCEFSCNLCFASRPISKALGCTDRHRNDLNLNRIEMEGGRWVKSFQSLIFHLKGVVGGAYGQGTGSAV